MTEAGGSERLLDRLEALLPRLVRSPGLSCLRGVETEAPVVAFAELPRGITKATLEALHSRALILAAGEATASLATLAFLPDLALPRSPAAARARLAVVGAPEALPDPEEALPSILVLEEALAWLASALGHGPTSRGGSGGRGERETLLLTALSLGEGPILWVGPAPEHGRAILAGASLAARRRDLLVTRGGPAWWPGQGRAVLQVCAEAWHPLAERARLEQDLVAAVRRGPRVASDLLPGLIARAAFDLDPASPLMPRHHQRWLAFGQALYDALAERGVSQAIDAEIRKYQVFWASGRACGHNSPGIQIYPMVRNYFLNAGLQSLLDVGCGGGEVLEAAQQDGMTVRGLDIADGLSGTPRASFLDRLVLAPAWEMPLEDDCVDAFFSSDVLEHLPPSRIDATLDELQRVSRYGGVLAISGRADVSGLAWGALLHLAVFPLEYWQSKLERRFTIDLVRCVSEDTNPLYLFLLRPQSAD